MHKLPMLIRREFWESRNYFVVLPVVIAAFMVLLMLVATILSGSSFVDINLELEERSGQDVYRLETDNVFSYVVAELEGQTDRRRGMTLKSGLQGVASPIIITLFFVVFFYLLDSLYSDRKDRSILFWKSLPISDSLTIASKLVTGLVVVPLVYLAIAAVVQLAGLLFLTFATFGTDISAWEVVWKPAPLIAIWGVFIAQLAFYWLWGLPIFAWLLAVSAFAKSAPLMWAVGVPVAIVVAERVFSSHSTIASWIADHSVPASFLVEDDDTFEYMFEQLISLQMLSALMVGGLLLFVATWLRRRADEI